MGRVAERSHVTPSEYLAWEREQRARHEYFDGEVFAMAGGSMRHNALCGAVVETLRTALRGRGCFVMTSDQRVAMDHGRRYVYPDVTGVCGEILMQPDARDVLLNPAILVEVLSASTEQYDRGLKWEGYQRIPSLTDYILASQAEARIEIFRRGADGAWTYRAVGAGERLTLTGGVELDVDAIYAGAFELPGDDPTPLPADDRRG
ncbi:MAG TPA: Uma2 family endonuclease [Kofleriaceae bacterium]|nr:Uma2 family endonuclease [Kofleriaceae bacterium]